MDSAILLFFFCYLAVRKQLKMGELPSVRVIARVRPALRPASIASEPCIALLDRTTLQVTQIEKNTLKRGLRPGDPPTQVIYQSTQPFSFDRVYWVTDSTEVLHAREVEPLVSAVLSGEGTTALCLAYGQTGVRVCVCV
jgi:hypothetical protein